MAHAWTASEIRLFKLAKPYLPVMHNDLHTKEAVRFAFKLLDLAGGDREIVIPAVILHDVGWSQIPEDIAIEARIPEGSPELVKIHEDKGVVIAREILGQVLDIPSMVGGRLYFLGGIPSSGKTGPKVRKKCFKPDRR